jgi:hypothetical protein
MLGAVSFSIVLSTATFYSTNATFTVCNFSVSSNLFIVSSTIPFSIVISTATFYFAGLHLVKSFDPPQIYFIGFLIIMFSFSANSNPYLVYHFFKAL